MLSFLFGLLLLPLTLAVPSAPFCVLQLALCKYCRGWLLPRLPLMLSAFGCVTGYCIIMESSNWEALTGFLILVPSLLGLIGSALGWAIWRYAQKHLY